MENISMEEVAPDIKTETNYDDDFHTIDDGSSQNNTTDFIKDEFIDCNKSLEVVNMDIKTETCEEMDDENNIDSDSQLDLSDMCFVECKTEN